MINTLRYVSLTLRNASLVTNNITVRNRIYVLVVAHHYSVTTKLYDNAIISTKSEETDTLKVEVENEDAIARQKERAIQYWNGSTSKYSEAMKDQVHDDVMHHLHHGKVLPIFHTLCHPPKERLFQPNEFL